MLSEFKIVETSKPQGGKFYKFILWDDQRQSNVIILDQGEWKDWGEFVAQARQFIDITTKKYENSFDDEDEFPFDDPRKIASQLIKVIPFQPDFVTQANIANEKMEIVPFSRAIPQFFKNVGWFILPYLFAGFMIFIVGALLWGVGQSVLGFFGVIDLQTSGERRYEAFLNSVVECQLVDSVSSSKRTSKWPLYAIYKCPDGSRRTWKTEVKVITDVGKKLILE